MTDDDSRPGRRPRRRGRPGGPPGTRRTWRSRSAGSRVHTGPDSGMRYCTGCNEYY